MSSAQPPSPAGGLPGHRCQDGAALAERLGAGQLDQALTEGLMGFEPCPGCDAVVAALLLDRQQRFLAAWAARDRYRQRQARLQGQADASRRATAGKDGAGPGTALPPAAAAALERARARAGVASKP